jgi:hypothetical protein
MRVDDLESATATRQRTSISAPTSANSRVRQPVASELVKEGSLNHVDQEPCPGPLGDVCLDCDGHFIVADQHDVFVMWGVSSPVLSRGQDWERPD